MSVSIEALAMAGADYVEWGIDMEEWEQREMERPPPHLLADEEEKEGDEKKMRGNMKYYCCSEVHFILRKISMFFRRW